MPGRFFLHRWNGGQGHLHGCCRILLPCRQHQWWRDAGTHCLPCLHLTRNHLVAPDTVDIQCPGGSWCAGGADTPIKCTAAPGHSCDIGSASTDGAICAQGTYCLGRDLVSKPCTAPAGSFCPAGSISPSGVLCPVGFFCEGGVADKKPCEAMLGKSCPQGTSVAFGKSCEPGTFCTGGSAEPAPCTAAPGFYCGVESSDPAG